MFFLFFFFNDTPTPEIYTLSLHDALPISVIHFFWDRILGTYRSPDAGQTQANGNPPDWRSRQISDRKSTRLNSSHTVISYAVFCLKKKKSDLHLRVGLLLVLLTFLVV